LTTNQYRCIVSNQHVTSTGAIIPDDNEVTISGIATLTVNNCTISGTLMYNNADKDLLAGMTVKESIGNKTAVVDAQGKYKITGVVSGIHTMSVTPGSAYFVGGINATDVGAVNKWLENTPSIPFVQYLAGDVNVSGPITQLDVSNIMLNFVKGQSFKRAPWTFWDASVNTSNNRNSLPDEPLKVTVNGQSIVLNLLGQVTGDFNGSLDPLNKNATSTLSLMNNTTTIKVKPGENIELPIRTNSAMTIGAVSLILNFPSDLVDVTGVWVDNNIIPPEYNENGNELRIGWTSLMPSNLNQGDKIVNLKLHIRDAFTSGKSARFTLVNNPLNEVANNNMVQIQNVVLNVDNLSGLIINPLVVTLNAYPNPFINNTTLNYSISNDAKVTLQIYNLLGIPVKTLVDENKSKGTYNVNLDASRMMPGTYYATIRVNDGNTSVDKTIKIILNR
jgi:hypothetical protein